MSHSPSPAALVALQELIAQSHEETRKVFAEVDGHTSPYQAAGQAADYMRESLLAALRALAAPQETPPTQWKVEQS